MSKRPRVGGRVSELEAALAFQIRALKLPAPVPEYRVCPDRRWRFDYAYPDLKLAIEVEGGAWVNGRHTRGSGFVADCDKYNRAATEGWRILRFTGSHIRSGEAVKVIEQALGARAGKDWPMSETLAEQLERVHSMAEDNGQTWDLSDNDKAALRAILTCLEAQEHCLEDANADIERLRAHIADLQEQALRRESALIAEIAEWLHRLRDEAFAERELYVSGSEPWEAQRHRGLAYEELERALRSGAWRGRTIDARNSGEGGRK